MYVLPISLFAYFSSHCSINSEVIVHRVLTYLALFDFLRYDPKNRENLNHYLNDNVHHFRGRSHFCVDLETSEKHLNPFKDVDKCILARSNIFSSLRDVSVTIAHTEL
jgi:hypothetical protein